MGSLLMLVKLIPCRVSRVRRGAFSAAQAHWSAMSAIDGFVAQTGGWTSEDGDLAVIVAFWRDRTCYDRFMRQVHDDIVARGGQSDTYEAIDTTLFDVVLGIGGPADDSTAAVREGDAIRIVRCQVKTVRLDHFRDVQRTVWNPGMAGAKGILGGVFCVNENDRADFLVCTFWKTVEDHRDYRTNVVPELRRLAEVERDVSRLEGFEVRVEPSWCVIGMRG